MLHMDRLGMNRGTSMLAGLGLGATLMYFLDSRGGGRRRALVRDKGAKLKRKTRETAPGRAEDVRNRMKGAAHELGLLNGANSSRKHAYSKRVTRHQIM